MAEKTIVCIHGLGASKAFFSTLARTSLAQNNRIIAMDLPGFGDRWTDPVGDQPITSAAEALASEVDKMGCQNVVLVGHSLGGAAALLTATMVSGQVWGLASLEGNLIAEDCGMSRRLAVAANLTECASMKTKAIDEAKHSENPGVRDWARDLSKVSPSTLLSYSRARSVVRWWRTIETFSDRKISQDLPARRRICRSSSVGPLGLDPCRIHQGCKPHQSRRRRT